MNRTEKRRAGQQSILSTALILAHYDPVEPVKLADGAELAEACSDLSLTLMINENIDNPAAELAADCAGILESLARRYRRAQRILSRADRSAA